jgi:hypothetical protein
MLKLPTVTLVCVTSVKVDRAINALNFSRRRIEFSEVLLITDKNVNPTGIKKINIKPLDYNGYSHFIIYELHKYINTEHVLIIQEDGFVVNPDKWSDEFLKYDYIGAPFPLPKASDNISYRDPFGNLMRVGNGGFSLRSKRILELATELKLEWKEYFGHWHEDGFFSCHNKHLYEENGCIYAPVEIAAKFSHERQTKDTLGIIPFGFHGKSHEYNKLI